MKLYIMRHGPAEDHSTSGRDGDRALTPAGEDRVRDVARLLATEGEEPLAIFTSPLTRSLQTAEIVASVTDLEKRGGKVEIRPEMAPGGDSLGLVIELVRAESKRVMIVGHEPDLSMFATRLLGHIPGDDMLKAMVIGVKLTQTDAEPGSIALCAKLRFVLNPKTLTCERS
jgi:phosphohistidine phosphatase